ncbi:MAG TPA: hypothetical protein VG269_20500 [Tepidisphaeraceae bacterium]|jgi:hypothetical protein|nr:hypothetical protein [Tepidisphaeraceae bacterium]
MSLRKTEAVQTVAVETEFFIYLAEENDFDHFPAARTFTRTCNRVVGWSAAAEFRAQKRAEAYLDENAEDVPDDDVMEKHLELQGDLFLHHHRAAMMVQQLVALASVPESIYGDFCCTAFEKSPHWAAKLLKPRNTLYLCLHPSAWPDHPGVPPFAVFRGDLFSPVPMKGMRLYDGCKPAHPRNFEFQVPSWFLEDGGWPAMKQGLTIRY